MSSVLHPPPTWLGVFENAKEQKGFKEMGWGKNKGFNGIDNAGPRCFDSLALDHGE